VPVPPLPGTSARVVRRCSSLPVPMSRTVEGLTPTHNLDGPQPTGGDLPPVNGHVDQTRSVPQAEPQWL
jgi:hypothetical protein